MGSCKQVKDHIKYGEMQVDTMSIHFLLRLFFQIPMSRLQTAMRSKANMWALIVKLMYV